MATKTSYERFLWFDFQVRAGKHPNATSLARKFEISAKTAQRDIDFMRDRLRAPLEYDKGFRGYRYSDRTFALPTVFVSSEELSALLIARKFLKDIRESYVGDELSSVVEKITSVLRQNVGDATAIDDVLSFQLIEHAPALEEVVKATLGGCLRKRRLQFLYKSANSGKESERTVDPYHLLNYMGTWHLLGYCHSREEIRDFHLGRVRDVRALEETFTLPHDFDVIDYVTSSFGLYKGELKQIVTLRFKPDKARWIRGQIWHRDQKVRDLPDGSLEMSFPIASYSEIVREVLKHGSGVEVIEPPELREMIREEALRVYETYSS